MALELALTEERKLNPGFVALDAVNDGRKIYTIVRDGDESDQDEANPVLMTSCGYFSRVKALMMLKMTLDMFYPERSRTLPRHFIELSDEEQIEEIRIASGVNLRLYTLQLDEGR